MERVNKYVWFSFVTGEKQADVFDLFSNGEAPFWEMQPGSCSALTESPCPRAFPTYCRPHFYPKDPRRESR